MGMRSSATRTRRGSATSTRSCCSRRWAARGGTGSPRYAAERTLTTLVTPGPEGHPAERPPARARLVTSRCFVPSRWHPSCSFRGQRRSENSLRRRTHHEEDDARSRADRVGRGAFGLRQVSVGREVGSADAGRGLCAAAISGDKRFAANFNRENVRRREWKNSRDQGKTPSFGAAPGHSRPSPFEATLRNFAYLLTSTSDGQLVHPMHRPRPCTLVRY